MHDLDFFLLSHIRLLCIFFFFLLSFLVSGFYVFFSSLLFFLGVRLLFSPFFFLGSSLTIGPLVFSCLDFGPMRRFRFYEFFFYFSFGIVGMWEVKRTGDGLTSI